jgi:hypothetical protein
MNRHEIVDLRRARLFCPRRIRPNASAFARTKTVTLCAAAELRFALGHEDPDARQSRIERDLVFACSQ